MVKNSYRILCIHPPYWNEDNIIVSFSLKMKYSLLSQHQLVCMCRFECVSVLNTNKHWNQGVHMWSCEGGTGIWRAHLRSLQEMGTRLQSEVHSFYLDPLHYTIPLSSPCYAYGKYRNVLTIRKYCPLGEGQLMAMLCFTRVHGFGLSGKAR